MKIQKTIQREEKIEIEIQTPAWYKLNVYDGFDFYQLNSEEDIIEVKVHAKYSTVNRQPMRYMWQPEKIVDGEVITEAEFFAALSEAITLITPPLPLPLLISETA